MTRRKGLSMQVGRGWLMLTLSTIACFMFLHGSAVKVLAQTESHSFEVVSVHPDKSDDINTWAIRATQSSWTCRNTPLEAVLWAAFDVKSYQIDSAPNWVHTEHYTIDAKYPESFYRLSDVQKAEETRLMLQSLLAQRFNLRFHRSSRQMNVYSLVRASDDVQIPVASSNENGSAIEFGTSMEVHGYTMSEFAQQLSSTLQETVLDKTGLLGRYSFTLKYPPSEGEPPNESGADKAARIYSSLREQLGLRIKSEKGPVPVIVIDSIEKPTEN